MSWRFNPCLPCCLCCPSGDFEWDVKAPANFGDGICTGAANLNGSLTMSEVAANPCYRGVGTGTPGVIPQGAFIECSQENQLITEAFKQYPTAYTFSGAWSFAVTALIAEETEGTVVAGGAPIFGTAASATSYTIQKSGCAIIITGGASSGNASASGVVRTWSTVLYVLDGLKAADLANGGTFSVPRRDISGAGLSASFLVEDHNFAVLHDYGPLLTGGFTGADATLTLHAP